MQILELAAPTGEDGEGPRVTHPYFIGAQFHPELTGRPLNPQPMFMGLVAAAIRRHEAAHGPGDARPWREDAEIVRWIREPGSPVHRV